MSGQHNTSPWVCREVFLTIVVMAALDFLTLLCIASPHILYAAIWYLPEIWRAQFGRESVQVFAHVATAGKGQPPLFHLQLTVHRLKPNIHVAAAVAGSHQPYSTKQCKTRRRAHWLPPPANSYCQYSETISVSKPPPPPLSHTPHCTKKGSH